jgi:hypothetical protein
MVSTKDHLTYKLQNSSMADRKVPWILFTQGAIFPKISPVFMSFFDCEFPWFFSVPLSIFRRGPLSQLLSS